MKDINPLDITQGPGILSYCFFGCLGVETLKIDPSTRMKFFIVFSIEGI